MFQFEEIKIFLTPLMKLIKKCCNVIFHRIYGVINDMLGDLVTYQW